MIRILVPSVGVGISLLLAACTLGLPNSQATREAEAVALTPYESTVLSPTLAEPPPADEPDLPEHAETKTRGATAAVANQRDVVSRGQSAHTSVTYNGEIEASETVAIAAEVSGPVVRVMVEEGEHVVAGQLLLQIDQALLRGQQAQAVAGLKSAQAQLDRLLADVDAEDLAAARAAAHAAATAYQELTAGPSAEDLRIAEATLRQSEAAVRRAQSAYNQVSWRNDIGALPQSENLHVATLAHEAAQAQYEKIVGGAPADAIAAAHAQLVQARTQVTNLQKGVDVEQITAAEAMVEQAEATLYLAAVQLAKTTVRAPMDGILLRKSVVPGAIAAPGSPLLTLMSETMNVTIAVEEFQLARLAVGQPATIAVNAYPDHSFTGEIVRIAPQLDPATRTVAVTIRPVGEGVEQLRPGMFATVELRADTSDDGPVATATDKQTSALVVQQVGE